MTYEVHRHDARQVSTLLEPESVDLIVTSPPYFALRSYRDGGEHYDGQLGSEPTPTEFVDALIACTADWLRVLKPTGSLWVNLGDKYTSTMYGRMGNPRNVAQANGEWSKQGRHGVHDTATTINPGGIPNKSLMGLPWRYALRCIDELGLILRAEVIWSKPNGLPESVTDRVRRSHEQWFHFTRQGRYFAAIDEVREAHSPISESIARRARASVERGDGGYSTKSADATQNYTSPMAQGLRDLNPLGKAPGSVWTIPSEPLVVPDELGVDHFAAFPSEWPRRIILGWSPSGYCTACGEPRRAVVEKQLEHVNHTTMAQANAGAEFGTSKRPPGIVAREQVSITGYACACPTPDAPTRPAVVLDPFAGTGTTVAVAHLLGRHGIGTDLSRDYLRLAEWRCASDQRLRDKVLDRTGIPNPKPPAIDGQMDLFAC